VSGAAKIGAEERRRSLIVSHESPHVVVGAPAELEESFGSRKWLPVVVQQAVRAREQTRFEHDRLLRTRVTGEDAKAQADHTQQLEEAAQKLREAIQALRAAQQAHQVALAASGTTPAAQPKVEPKPEPTPATPPPPVTERSVATLEADLKGLLKILGMSSLSEEDRATYRLQLQKIRAPLA
jgi:hypothetical protein